ncbi:Hypothetical predicted protein [Mytilus galloprovincialis]|uniref:C3H1-type domain-containing protein n=1 Tax=Mytilus galloprovincialis TaxID=29158 RepID=A0A8B6D4C9_MYTGA|nr:Hypothetical predicted protein [Mytilus galloprovincialis]
MFGIPCYYMIKSIAKKQADELFEWGIYRQDLRDFQLVSKRDNPTFRAFSEASVGASKGRGRNSRPGIDERRKGPFLPDGREICRNFNSNSCFRSDCRMMHSCAICFSNAHSALNGHSQPQNRPKKLEIASKSGIVVNRKATSTTNWFAFRGLGSSFAYRHRRPYRSKVENQIKKEIELGNYIVTKSIPTIVSSLGAVPKPNGDIRLIHDASQPIGISLNSYTSDTNCAYMDMRHALKLIKPNSFLAKIDLKSAYRSVCCHVSDHNLTGLKWTFLGIIIDTRELTLTMPPEKQSDFYNLLLSFQKRKRASIKQIQSLCGKLNWACQMVKGGRTFLRRLINSISSAQNRNDKVLLNSEFKADISWWINFMSVFNGTVKFMDFKPITSLQTDASSLGGGGYYNGD